MWPFKTTKTLAASGLLKGITDCHCHILPGVDDGVQSIDESIDILEEYEALGITEVWLTPHIMEDAPNTPEQLKARYDELLAAYTGNIKLNLAAENMLDGLFAERFGARDLLLMSENRLLVETSYYTPPMNLDAQLKQICSAGIRPILAHPERYVYMENVDYERVKSYGVQLQLNLGSVAGIYGEHVQKKAKMISDKFGYDMCGTDVHSSHMLHSIIDTKTKYADMVEKIKSIQN